MAPASVPDWCSERLRHGGRAPAELGSVIANFYSSDPFDQFHFSRQQRFCSGVSFQAPNSEGMWLAAGLMMQLLFYT
jgi:hypothetical protein